MIDAEKKTQCQTFHEMGLSKHYSWQRYHYQLVPYSNHNQKVCCKQLQLFSFCSILMLTLTIANQKDRCKELQLFLSCSVLMPTQTIANQKDRCKELQHFSSCSVLMLTIAIANQKDHCKQFQHYLFFFDKVDS